MSKPVKFSMLSLAKQIYVEYHPLIGKLHVENSKNDHGFEEFEWDM
jgi:hypothetical protein